MSEQAAIDKSNPSGTADGESGDALDDLLREFEQGTQQETGQPAVTSNDVKAVVQYVQEEQQRSVKQATDDGINNAVKTIKEGLEVNIPDRAVRGILFDLAEGNDNFIRAFNDRDKNPNAWNKVLKSIQKEVKEEFNVDPNATAEQNALKAAVHSSKSVTQETDDAPDYAKMSDAEFSKALQEFS